MEYNHGVQNNKPEENRAEIKRRVKKRPSPEEVQRLKQLGNDVMDQVDRLRLQDMWDTPALKTARRIRALDKADAVHKIIVQLTKLILTQYVSLKKIYSSSHQAKFATPIGRSSI